MRDNVYEKALNNVVERINLASQSLSKQFKNTMPFGTKKIDNSEMLSYYNGLTPEDMGFLIQKHGRDKVNTFIQNMELLKRRQNNDNASSFDTGRTTI